MKKKQPSYTPRRAQELEQEIGHCFANPDLLRTSLTHPSRSNEAPVGSPARQNYEQLEFLGDAVLSFTVADYLYRHYAHLDEGILSSARKEVVEKDALQGYARAISLGDYISFGNGAQHLRDTPSVLENVFEALIGALYMDAGLAVAQPFILRFIVADIERTVPFLVRFGSATDCKTRLQQFVQEDHKNASRIEYVDIGRTGPDHMPVYTVAVLLDGQEIATGSGSSKKDAQQEAARNALHLFASEPKVSVPHV